MYRNDHDILPNEVVYVGEERSYNFSLNFYNISRTMLVVMIDYYDGEKKAIFSSEIYSWFLYFEMHNYCRRQKTNIFPSIICSS
jgi:hypothetical protein